MPKAAPKKPKIPPISVVRTELVPVAKLKPYPGNARRGDEAGIGASVDDHGQYKALVANLRTHEVLVGNHTLKVLKSKGAKQVLVSWLDVSRDEAREINLIDNRLPDRGSYDETALSRLLEAARNAGGIPRTGYDVAYADELLARLRAATGTPAPAGPTLADRFMIPPFSVLNAREGWWQDRKRAWIAIGIESELGRDAAIGGSPMPLDRQAAERGKAHKSQGRLTALMKTGRSAVDTYPVGKGGGMSEAQAPRKANGAAPAAEWAQGYDIEQLRELAAAFTAHDAPYTFGRFGRVNEAEVAGWAAAGAVRCVRAGGQIVAAIVVQEAKAASEWGDFAGTPLAQIAKGDTRIMRAACTEAGAAQLAALLRDAAPPGRAAWAKVLQESPRVRAALRAAGFAWLGSDVSAASEVIGIWGTAHGAGRSRAEDAPALARLRLKIPQALAAEAAAAVAASNPQWAAHYSAYNKRDSWHALALRGFGGRADFIEKPAEMSKAWRAEHPKELAWRCKDTPLAAALPAVMALAEIVPGAKERVRLMRLAPGGGELARHADITDPDAGTLPGKQMRIHIPLVTNPGVLFRQWLASGQSLERHMPAGEAWYLDTRKPHTAVNSGTAERVHLVMDVAASPELCALLEWVDPPPAADEAAPPEEPLGETWAPARAPSGKTKAVVGDSPKGGLTFSGPAASFDHYRVKEGTKDSSDVSGTSIFDPVLTELLLRWFSGPGAEVLDPFAGGSVRGIVSCKLGRSYTGIELRAEQVEANLAQGRIMRKGEPVPAWIVGDSLERLPQLPKAYAADMILSCPPYADLEVYSDDERDISNMPYDKFLGAYREIIRLACERLRADRFACWVVGEVRDKRGIYRNLVGETVAAFEAAGALYYNEAVLVTAVGSLPVRAARAFEAARKLGRTHQAVLVFVKGDPKAAAGACGKVEIPEDIGAEEDEEEREEREPEEREGAEA